MAQCWSNCLIVLKPFCRSVTPKEGSSLCMCVVLLKALQGHPRFNSARGGEGVKRVGSRLASNQASLLLGQETTLAHSECSSCRHMHRILYTYACMFPSEAAMQRLNAEPQKAHIFLLKSVYFHIFYFLSCTNRLVLKL